MATSKHYAYYLEGNQVAIVEKDVSFDNDVDSKDYGPGASKQRWESPQSAVEDGLEIKYVYSPTYRIEETQDVDTSLNAYRADEGYLVVSDQKVGYINYGTDLAGGYVPLPGSYIVLTNAGKFNGLHKVFSFLSDTGTQNSIKLYTRYSGSTSFTSFEDVPNMYFNIDTLEDEGHVFDLPNYLQKALVYYVKGKLAEDAGNIELRQYAMREFAKMIEKYENTRIRGLRIVSPGFHAIR